MCTMVTLLIEFWKTVAARWSSDIDESEIIKNQNARKNISMLFSEGPDELYDDDYQIDDEDDW